MLKRVGIFFLSFGLVLNIPIPQVLGDQPQYSSNPFSFNVSESVHGYGSAIFVADLNGDGLMDYTFRSSARLYAYDHFGSHMWNTAIGYPGPAINNHGSKHGAADIDGDGTVEIVALNDQNEVIVFHGSTGEVENTLSIAVGADQKAGHVIVANLRGAGDRDIIVHTMDTRLEGDGYEYYINRTVIAIRMDSMQEMWRVEQDRITGNGIYEGFWGPAHGPAFCADVDGDGRDEVVGGNMIDHNGALIQLGYPSSWVFAGPTYIDHLDAVAVGNFRQDLSGLEWVVTDEDGAGRIQWNTSLMRIGGIIWAQETTMFPEGDPYNDREPQNVAVGNFDLNRMHAEVWVRSRFCDDDDPFTSQHPWVFDAYGGQFADYNTSDVLPSGFNTHPNGGNGRGLEMIWTIDWTGEKKEYIAGKARHVNGKVGVFDAVTGGAIWVSPSIAATTLYVADVAGDSREEIVVYDQSSGSIKVFWNGTANSNQPKPDKWADPLYRRLKQNWNYYSPGGYTSGDYPIISNITVSDITPSSATITWNTDEPSDSQVEYGLTDAYGSMTSTDPVLRTSHAVQLTGLAQGTEYHFRVRSRNTYGKLGFSSDNDGLVTYSLDPPMITGSSVQGSNQLQLTWTETSGATGYNVYRGPTATFTPDLAGGSNRIAANINDEDGGTDAVQWSDPSGNVGDWQTNDFYAVTSIVGGGESEPSTYVGEFDYELILTATTDFNEIALPFVLPGISNAADLLALLPDCNGIARWDAEIQGYDQYSPLIPITNFAVEMGHPYYVNATANTVCTFSGSLANPAFNLITTETTDFNEVMVPLDKSYITKASELLADIPNCDGVAYWNPEIQGYEQYFYLIPITDFVVRVGYPYYVNVSADVTWPVGEMVKRVNAKTTAVQAPEWSHAPHLVYGKIDFDGRTTQVKNLNFSAFMDSRPGEILTDASPGCTIEGDYWIVQCGNFRSPWKAGEILRVQFDTGEESSDLTVETPLTYAPADESKKLVIGDRLPHPVDFELSQNYPNPFNSWTIFRYAIPEEGQVRIEIFDTKGRMIRCLVDNTRKPGVHSIVWDGKDSGERDVETGMYLVRMETEKYTETRKLMLVR